MDSSLHEVWQAAAGSPFFPTVNKDTQFTLAFALLLVGFFLTGVFALSMRHSSLVHLPLLTFFRPHSDQRSPTRHSSFSRTWVRFLSTINCHLKMLTSTGSESSICSVRSESTFKIPKSPRFGRFRVK